jgi:hypothetical protein
MMWHLLYDASWRLPTDTAEAAWRDALGETDVMKVCLSAPCLARPALLSPLEPRGPGHLGAAMPNLPRLHAAPGLAGACSLGQMNVSSPEQGTHVWLVDKDRKPYSACRKLYTALYRRWCLYNVWLLNKDRKPYSACRKLYTLLYRQWCLPGQEGVVGDAGVSPEAAEQNCL